MKERKGNKRQVNGSHITIYTPSLFSLHQLFIRYFLTVKEGGQG